MCKHPIQLTFGFGSAIRPAGIHVGAAVGLTMMALPSHRGLCAQACNGSKNVKLNTRNCVAPVVAFPRCCGSTPASCSSGGHPHRPSAASVSSQPASSDVPLAPLESITSLSSYEDNQKCVPEDFELPAGVVSRVDRISPLAPEDAFRCIGCTNAECQVGCSVMVQPSTWQAGQVQLLLTWQVASSRPASCARHACVVHWG